MMAPPFVTSPMLASVAHGFFGRAGGVSTGIYASLNCGPGSDDDPAAVAENRERCLKALGADTLTTVYQVHSEKVLYTEEPFDTLPQVDAIVTDRPGLAIGILTADCMPVLLHEPRAGVIGAAHAGWRGALAGVLENTVAEMIRRGANTALIHAAIGPCLRRENFEVGLDLLDAFTDKYAQSTRFFTPGKTEDKRQLDLAGYGRWRLEEAGLDPAHIDEGEICTLARPQDYFSYRYTRRNGEPDYGRNLSAIVLPRAK